MANIRRNLGIPAGVVFQSAAINAPHGYLLCNGSEVLKTDYPELYASIGDTYGTPTGGALYFCLPDYRGVFLRGYDGAAGKDTDKASRTAMKTGAVTGNNVGSVQSDAIRNIAGTWSVSDVNPLRGTQSLTGPFYTAPGSSAFRGGYDSGGGSPLGFDASRTVPTGSDNRPINVSVNYIIKY